MKTKPDAEYSTRILADALNAHGDLTVNVPKGPDYLRHGRLDEWRRILGEAGFAAESVTVTKIDAEWDVPTDFFLFEAERHAGVRTAALLEAQTPDALWNIGQHMTRAVRAYEKDGAYAIPYAAYVIAARRPVG